MFGLHLLNLDGCGVADEGAGHCESLNNSQIIFSRSRSEHFHLGRDVTDGSFDIVVVDAADGGNAPPDALASPAFFADVGRVLAPRPAVLAVNVVARDAETLARVRDAAACVGGELFECELPAPLVADGSPDFARLLFAVRGDVFPSLAGHHPLLAHVDEGELWMQGFRGLV